MAVRLSLAGLMIVVLSLGATVQVRAGEWTVDMDKSRLGFIATQSGAEFSGRFHKFAAKIVFSPDDLEHSFVDVEIDMSSVDTQSKDRDRDIGTSDWFHSGAFPTARFLTNRFVAKGDGHYEAYARLTIRDVGLDVVLPFELSIEGDPNGGKRATIKGQLDLLRNNWGIGQGQWVDTGTIGGTVVVTVDLTATQKN